MTEREMPTFEAADFAAWPWQRCPARTGHTKVLPSVHCDLRRGHDGIHCAERGLGADELWTEKWFG